MEIPASIRQLLRNIRSVSQVPPSWLWLNVNNPVHETLRPEGLPVLVRAAKTERLAQVIEQIPSGGHLATFRSPWLRDLVKALLGSEGKPANHLILPIHHHGSLLGCVGWDKSTYTSSDPTESLSALRQALRSAWDLEMTLTECYGLRWALFRSDRITAVARPNGSIVAASPAASDLMKSLQFGSRHYLHDGTLELPPRLAGSLRVNSSGQIKLTQSCTVRFDPINSNRSWLPLIAIEFFVEAQRIPPPISGLTPVERHVYELIMAGASNREIASQRGTSFATAKNQVAAILAKMNVSRRHHLMIRGTEPITSPAQLNSPGMNGVTISRR